MMMPPSVAIAVMEIAVAGQSTILGTGVAPVSFPSPFKFGPLFADSLGMRYALCILAGIIIGAALTALGFFLAG